ncbi:PDR/VanB family oxidoreductase [Acetobacter conturbans]|uniref:2Fe-2S iron-sulfur cluster binding domain-containing protein n=1 Tax=Acetobacter conturbans TaxID=1737472 RepID=A0ABX0K5J4_9PROT|nr:PDR/VanB family oxidoreductase [Acetobacter conturbans]NHN89628.1 2Fe-2S iron-sulfur cluster binding domain-containing protein [Acetobacter conturbans]
MSPLFPVLVQEATPEGRDCVRLRLTALEGQDALPAFEPGAHIDVMTPSGLIRQYSLCGSADDREAYELCVKRENNSRGGSESLCSKAQPGMELQISHPRNAFPLPAAQRYILIGGGIGITPLLSMMGRLKQGGADWELHYYAREPEHAPFREALLNGPESDRVHLHQSIRNGYPEALSTPSPDTVIMLCGPTGFMDAVFAQAVANGWQTDQVRTEHFRPTESSHDEEDRPFDVVLARSGQTIAVPAGQSIASALLAAGIDVSLSCEQGMCGACVVPLLAGEADHRDMILTEEEQGCNIALCCSRARSPVLTVEL